MLNRVVIKNYKSLDVDVRLDPVTVLVGKSGVGKTNFVNGLRFVRDLVSGRGLHLPSARPATAQGDCELSIRIEYSVEGFNGDFVYEVAIHSRGTVERESLWLGEKPIFSIEKSTWVHQPNLVPLPQPTQGKMLGQLSGLLEASVACRALSHGLGCYSFPDSVMRDSNKDGTNGLSDSGSNFHQVFKELVGNVSRLSDWRSVNRALAALNPTVDAVDLGRSGAIAVTHKANGKKVVLPIVDESEGFRRFLTYLLAMYQAPPKQTMVFEEPEKGIHPGALEILVDEIKTCADTGRGQVILTTHSPQLLDLFPPETIRVVEMTNLVTRIGPFGAGQFDSLKQRLLMPGELLTVDFARMDPMEAVHEP